MKVVLWEGGLERQEIVAIEKIEKAFTEAKLPNDDKGSRRGGSLKDLGGLIPGAKRVSDNPMFNWKGYAGFRFVDSKRNEGEFDLLIITHSIILIVELKDWNHQPVRSQGEIWFKGNKNMGRSPVSVTRNKVYLIRNKINRLKSKFTNKGFVPFVEYLVVMTGSSDFSGISETDRNHTISLEDFIALSNKKNFDKRFPSRHLKQEQLYKDIPLFDELFTDTNVEPKPFSIDGWVSKDLIFEHPVKIYREYLAVSETSETDEALIRSWDFSKLDSTASKTPDGRFKIVSRERDVLKFIKHQDLDLYNHCLTSLTIPQSDNITSKYSEVYELPPAHYRFNKFIVKFCSALDGRDRLNLFKRLLAKFADLHEMKVAHRDLGDHSIWISPGKEMALSNFISAYHQPIGTVGPEGVVLSVNEGSAPQGMIVNEKTTPFHMDVYALAILGWHILNGNRLSLTSRQKMPEELANSEDWFAEVFRDAIDNQFYRYAGDFFEGLKSAEPRDEKRFVFDVSALDVYREDINHSRAYREDDDFIVETSRKEVYVSNNQIVKAWLNINPTELNPGVAQKVGFFLQRIVKLQSVAPLYLPTIRHFGLASKSSSMFVVSALIEGEEWGKQKLDEHEKWSVIDQLISAVESYHDLGFSHGDLHPSNVIICKVSDVLRLYLIDTPDFCLDEGQPYNFRYSPENVIGSSSFERDIFAVIRMSAELLGIEWGQGSTQFPAISKAITTEIEDTDFGFKDLSRFRDAILSPELSNETTVETIEVNLSGDFPELTIYPENGQIFVSIVERNKNPSDVLIKFSGVGGVVSFIYSSSSKEFVFGIKPYIQSSLRKSDRDNAQLSLPFAIKILNDSRQKLKSINDRLSNDEDFQRALALYFIQKTPKNSIAKQTNESLNKLQNSVAQQIKEESNEVSNSVALENKNVLITTRRLWQAVLDTEAESHPFIEIEGDIYEPDGFPNQLIIPCDSETAALDGFNRKDDIEAIQLKGDNERRIGTVQLKFSSLKEVRLIKPTTAAKGLKQGDILFFRTRQDKASYEKRKNALERLLNSKSVVSDLALRFEPGCSLEATTYDVTVSDEDFDRYDRTDDYGNIIRLNEKQRFAFKKIIQNGPLSMLQGPPGTGKTEFIAAFVHYLVEKQGAKNILLVSQSHEAVNTAAERIRQHCRRLDTNLEAVRFSNRLGTVSNGLKDVYSNTIVQEKRELFKAEAKYRIKSLAKPLGLDSEYLQRLSELEFGIFQQIRLLEHSNNKLVEGSFDQYETKELEDYVYEKFQAIQYLILEKFDLLIDTIDEFAALKIKIYSSLEAEFSIRPDESKKATALMKISTDMLGVLETDRVNYDEFLARSRQLVTGTCVGIGQRHMEIVNNQYDWVIIDEAARSIASELAIAMQTGKRILLVGDHKQLPPQYSEPHKKALARKLGIASRGSDLDDMLASDFSRAFESSYGLQTGAQLLTQYRMAASIGDLVSNCFYQGELENGERTIPKIYDNVSRVLDSHVTWLDTSSFGKLANHLSDKGVSIYNRCEADLIMDLLKEISENTSFVSELSGFVKNGEAAIGIICMYGQQKRVLTQKFIQQDWDDKFKLLVKIDTVDSYQGKENRIIILSVTRSANDLKPGFLRSPNRINVALSRAMDRLVIVSDRNMWRGNNANLPLGRVATYIDNQNDDTKYQVLDGKGAKS